MRTIFSLIAILMSPALLSAQSSGPGAAAYRAFTSTTGKEVRARLMAVEGDKARLRMSDGKEFAVPISGLVVDDQAYIAAWDPRERHRASLEGGGVGEGLAKHLEASGYLSAPLKLQGKTIEVEAAVNGEAERMLFDSGRVLTLIDTRFAGKTGVKIHEDIDFGEFRMSDGSVLKVLAGSTREFSLGGAKIPEFELGVVDLAKIGIEGVGVIGSDVLQYFDGLVDWHAMRIFLKPQS